MGMNGQPTNEVWGYAPAGGRQVAVGVYGGMPAWEHANPLRLRKL